MTKEEYGYSDIFATASDSLNEHLIRWENAFNPNERMNFLTATMMLVNNYAIQLAKKDKKIENFKKNLITNTEELNE